jgi:hypothetical protein
MNKKIAAIVSIAIVIGMTAFLWQQSGFAYFSGSYQSTWKPSPCTYIIDTNGTYFFMINGVTGSMDYCSTSASSVIQSAIGNISNIGCGGKIVFKNGNYTLTSSIDLTGVYSLSLEGETEPVYPLTNSGARLTLTGSSGISVIKKTEPFFGAHDGITISNLYIYGNAGNPATKALIYMENVSRIYIRNCIMSNSRSSAIELNNSRWVWIEDNIIGIDNQTNQGNIGSGILADGISQVWISGNSMIGNGFLYSYGNGIYIKSNSAVSEDIHIFGNQIVHNLGYGILLEKGVYTMWLTEILGNSINENGEDGIRTTGQVTNCRISDNDIVDNSQASTNSYDGIRLDGAVNMTVWNNRIVALQGYQRYGITLSNASWCWVEENNLNGNHLGAVNLLGTTTNLTVSHNGGFITENSGTGHYVADQGYIAHGLSSTPTSIIVASSVAGNTVSVVWKNSTHFQVAIKLSNGSSGTQEDIPWYAEYKP